MTYADALAAMVAGKAVTRPAMGAGCSVFLVKEVNGAAEAQPWFAFVRPGAVGFLPWTPQPADQLAVDWAEVAG